ncbi:MAG: TnpV protein [Clostridiales Family XIII bacterium]|jgi:hypothetical protein|nr:TnpV protein [Clostridiales Family XIII bacterium]
MEITYTRVGDYLLPNLTLTERRGEHPPLGCYGTLHKAYLREYRPILYSQLLLSERLYPLCRDVDEAAATRLRTIPDRERAREVILNELVYD